MFEMWTRSEKYSMICSIIGAHLIVTPMSFMWCFGNLLAYMDSYFHLACAPRCNDGNSAWILPIYNAGTCIGIYCFGYAAKIINLNWLGPIAAASFNLALLACAWVFKYSVIGTTVLFGVVMGFSLGFIFCISLVYLQKWSPENVGFLTGTMTGFPTLLAVVENQIITAYVNPHNLKPDVVVGPRAFFSQPQILERIQMVIVILACIVIGLQVLGFLLVTTPPDSSSTSKNEDCENQKIKHDVSPQSLETTSTTGEKTLKSYGSNEPRTENHESLHISLKPEDSVATEKSTEKAQAQARLAKSTPYSYKPKDALQTGAFWALWVTAFAVLFCLLLKNTYYKQFGLLYIPNDNFMTLVGTLIPFASIAGRVISGILMDRGIWSIKDTLMFMTAIDALFSALWFFAPQVGKAAYVILILALAVAHGTFFSYYATATLRLFGPNNFSILYGVICLTGPVSAITTSVIVNPILQALGWFWLFAVCSAINVVTLIFAVFTNFDIIK